jgi:hypothetical protein
MKYLFRFMGRVILVCLIFVGGMLLAFLSVLWDGNTQVFKDWKAWLYHVFLLRNVFDTFFGPGKRLLFYEITRKS